VWWEGKKELLFQQTDTTTQPKQERQTASAKPAPGGCRACTRVTANKFAAAIIHSNNKQGAVDCVIVCAMTCDDIPSSYLREGWHAHVMGKQEGASTDY
jgi:hypothetical protein